MSTPEVLQWLNVLLLPIMASLASMKSDLAAVRATLEAHHLRLNRLEATKP